MNMRKGNLIITMIILSLGLFIPSKCISIASNMDDNIIAIFPLKNYSDDKTALTTIYPLIEKKIEERNFSVLDAEILKRFLIENRVRDKGYVDRKIGKKLFEHYNVKAILTGSINTYYQGDNPQVGLSLRLIDSLTGSIRWAEHGSITNKDFRSIFGEVIKKDVNELSLILINKLFNSLNVGNLHTKEKNPYRVGVMPLANRTDRKNLGIIATHILIEKLFKERNIEPIEFGNTRNLIVNLKINQKGEIDLKSAINIAKALNLDGIIVGSVETLKYEPNIDSAPEAEISARLIDTNIGKIIWSGFSHFRGDEKTIILDFGKIRSPEGVLAEALSMIANDMGKSLIKRNNYTKYQVERLIP